MSHDEERIRKLAYELWEKEGRPDGRDQEFWERARAKLDVEARGDIQTPLGSRTPDEKKVDEASEKSFPASDPPSHSAAVGARAETPPDAR